MTIKPRYLLIALIAALSACDSSTKSVCHMMMKDMHGQ
jgi:hypothetical protein